MQDFTVEESFLEEFNKNFSDLKHMPIVLYGIGQYTKLILEKTNDFHIVGLMDSKTTGEIIYGLPVLEEEAVAKMAKAIIIVATISISPVIYHRIENFVIQNKLPVYYLNGLQPETYDETIEKNPDWQKNKEKLKKEILAHEVISFDIFDTLIMRKCLEPTVIFEMMENRQNQEKLADFKQIRMDTEKFCYRNKTKFYYLSDIYEEIKKQYSLSDFEMEKQMKLELALEWANVMPRKEMVSIFDYAKKQGKEVVLTSDMYLNVSQMEKLLKYCGIDGYDKIFLSCEQKGSKYLGTLWEKIQKQYQDKTILHIGDNTLSDGDNAEKNGIDTFLIKSANDLLKSTGLNDIKKEVKTLDDKLLLGNFLQYCFHDPFFAHEKKGKIEIKNMYDFGYLFLGPLVLKYMCWLFQELEKEKLDYMLFIARDGYLFQQLYQKFMDKMDFNDAPDPIYFLTSRRAASVACIESENDIWFILDKLCGVSSIKYQDLLYHSFGISIYPTDPNYDKTILEMGKNTLFSEIKKMYLEKILKNAEKERAGYEEYIKTLKMKKNAKCGFFNFISRGVTQKYVSKLFNCQLIGMYFASEINLCQILEKQDQVKTCFGKNLSTHTAKQNIFSKYLFGETIFTAPQEQLLFFDEKGIPVYAENSHRDIEKILECQKGIMQLVQDMTEDFSCYKANYSKELADNLFGLFSKKNFVLDKSVEEGFLFRDDYSQKETTKLILN